MSNHTPGPWRVYEDDVEGIHIMGHGAPNEEICIICEKVMTGADAQLIAAAPELLAALKDMLTLRETLQDMLAMRVAVPQDFLLDANRIIEKAQTVIAKIEG
jgi:hypothetical protein